jgi:glycosyltransferase EpsF
MKKDPIRIAQIVGNMHSGGVEAVVMNYYRNIDRTKIQFDFIVHDNSSVPQKEEIEHLGGKILFTPSYIHLFKYLKELRKIFKENKYKIVHSHLNSLSIFPLYAAKKEGIPVRIAHNHSTSNIKEWKITLLKTMLKPFSKIQATEYFACSELAARWLFGNKAFEEGKVIIIANAIDLEKFKHNNKIGTKIKKDLNIDSSKKIIGHVGRFVKQKNHEFLIEIFKEINIENKNTALLLIGEGPLKNKIKEKVKKLKLDKSVYFAGAVNNVNEYMQAMDLFLFPSLYEGLGMVAVEAQTAGLPCVVSTELPKDVAITNKCIFISLSEDVSKWKDNILILLKENKIETKKLPNITQFDITKKAHELEEKYLELIK